MKLTPAQQAKIREQRGICVNEACDKCGQLLGYVRYTRKDQRGEWCLRECRDGKTAADARTEKRRLRASRPLVRRKGGRQRKYETNAERQRAYRQGRSGALRNRLAAD